MAQENERRYLLPGIVPSTDFHNPQQLEQGYFETPPHKIFRIRATDRKDFEMTTKHGVGESRDEQNCALSEEQFNFLRNACVYPITKTRYDRGGWTVDCHHGPLEGLVDIEYERGDGVAAPALPDWVNPAEAIDVTNSITNYDLARLARELTLNPLQGMTVYEFLRASVELPMIVVTGPPCSGKTTALNALQEKYGADIHFVPEAASIIIGQVGIPFPVGDPFAIARFQQTLATIQRGFEFLVKTQAVRSKKRAIVLDRGDVDCAAYLPNGLDDFEIITQVTREYAYARYRSVICLAAPPPDIFEQYRANNPTRTETYEAVCGLGEAMQSVWGNHPAYTFIANGSSWQEKCQAVENALLSFL